MRLLVIEDSVRLQQSLSTALRRSGYFGGGTILLVGTHSGVTVLQLLHAGPRSDIGFKIQDDGGLELKLDDFFTQRGLAFVVTNNKKMIWYALPDTADETAQVVHDLLVLCFGIKENDPLTFTLAD